MNPFLRALVIAAGVVLIVVSPSMTMGPEMSAISLMGSIFFAVICYLMAAKRGRDKWMWAVWGGGVFVIFGVIVLIAAGKTDAKKFKEARMIAEAGNIGPPTPPSTPPPSERHTN